MIPVENHPLKAQQKETLTELIETCQETLDQAEESSANRAFNLGCSVGLIPAALFVLLAYILSKGSWIAAAITSLLMVIMLMGFASLSASIARKNTLQRTYQEKVKPSIEAALAEMGVNRSSLDALADEMLPVGSALRDYFSIPAGQEENKLSDDTTQNEEKL